MAWEMQVGDPAEFAFKIGLLGNPHGDADRATVEERESWGYFTIYVCNENLCAHREEGVILEAAYWYTLPILEWFVQHWDAMFHEERPPLTNSAASAADSLARSKQPPLSLKEVDEFEWLDTWSDWWGRHAIRAAREGGVFPDIYIRRLRDQLEISTGSDRLPDIPSHIQFLNRQRTYYVDVSRVAEAIHEVLTAALGELRRRIPNSERLQDLALALQALRSAQKLPEVRLAWLAGYGDKLDLYRQVSAAVDEVLESSSTEVNESLTRDSRTNQLVVVGTPYARLLYGAVSPRTTVEDVVTLTRLLVQNYVPDSSGWLQRLSAVELPIDEVRDLPPGPQGSYLGERVCEMLGATSESWVDIASLFDDFEIAVSSVTLADRNLRAVSVFGTHQRPHVYWNTAFSWGDTEEIQRFTLAHELCHLLLDREYGDELGIASGAWAPVAVEQRANAFAASFLAPTWLLRDAASTGETMTSRASIKRVAQKLRVSTSSLVDRLYNLGEISGDERIRLREIPLHTLPHDTN